MTDLVVCSDCGETHSIWSMELCFKRPDAIAALSETQRTEWCKETRDLSALWGSNESEHKYFVRGVMPFAVREQNRDYCLGVWVEVERQWFDRTLELWDDERQSEQAPFPGLLANSIPFHASTLGLAVEVRLTGSSTRPAFFLRKSEHLLYLEQVHGISVHQAAQYTSLVETR